jgi:hypothetical protein
MLVVPKPPWALLAVGLVSPLSDLAINIAVLVRGWRQKDRTAAAAGVQCAGRGAEGRMYIRKLHIENIRGFVGGEA